MPKPFILINLKTYMEASGQRAHSIAGAAQQVAEESGVEIGIAPSYMNIHPLSMHYSLPVYSQHVDAALPGANTGAVTVEAIREAGATGSLVNHSERRLTLADIEAVVSRLREADLVSVVCTNNVATSAAAAALGPDFVAIEPPELIGGNVSVSSANPGIITGTVEAVRKVNPSVRILTGAGIHSGECVKTAIDLGTDGVLLASGVVKAKAPIAVLRDLVSRL
ncbi:MAG TPA: triose-phosphate isomerase [Methanolinea sp.]|jgi:triosephosphate isomerase|nr:triose-phosphate isomerase [Methanolinea sp.]HPC54923.1 triose-phosphate isomerase [Methanolinea sp.]HQE85332.1 triose-phosphate isomerase [Methanolinea sp.]HQI14300.1 triose-phosphate isomerase [Methanolinea sp.]HQJ18077.1 triose-phosphate isomerase [Methanolinea sp.]